MTTRVRAIIRSPGVTALLAVALAGACGSSNSTPTAQPTTTTHPVARTKATLSFRPVFCAIPNQIATAPTVEETLSERTCLSADTAMLATTPPADDNLKATVDLPYYDHSIRYILGPADLTAAVLKGASIVPPANGGGYSIELLFTPSGAAAFDRVAAERYPFSRASSSPPDYRSIEAVDLDGVVMSAPTIQARSFNGIAVVSGSTSAPFTLAQAQGFAADVEAATGAVSAATSGH